MNQERAEKKGSRRNSGGRYAERGGEGEFEEGGEGEEEGKEHVNEEVKERKLKWMKEGMEGAE